MYSATFIFQAGEFDEQFHQLDQEIATAAKRSVGYLGEESWEDPKTGRIANVYYWESEAGLHELMRDPQHATAKRRQGEWLDGYQVVISQVLRSYGDGKLPHPTVRDQQAT
ncbi:antibiotic biosynthesis monooxygenase [Chitinimonas sp.]|uniref:antibiotic biosynthesis monooxygenase family protein n=1 Tax=Chitinimonas sp. TaxID=1934313 RepID=UPI0035B1725B